MAIRPAAVSGLFYPAEPERLRADVLAYLAAGEQRRRQQNVLAPLTKLKALIVPHAGYMYSGATAGRAYAELACLKKKPRKILLLGPAHRVYTPFISVAAVQAYQTPLGPVNVSEIALTLAQTYGFMPAVHQQEHSLEVQLPFLQCILPDFELIPIVVGGADPARLATVIAPLLDDETLLLISTDLSHFLTDDQARQRDAQSHQGIVNLDIEGFRQKGDACGKIGVLMAMILAKQNRWASFFLDYTNSSDASGDRSRVVGYGAYAMGLTTNHEDKQQ